MSLVISGYGGQGILFLGTIIAKCAMLAKKNVTWLPSYGAEMRGGTANCTIVVSDNEISSPYQQNPNYVIALNAQSVEKFESKIKPGGAIIVNSSLYKGQEKRTDISYTHIPANEIAQKIGEIKCANVVMLSAFIQKTKLVNLQGLKNILSSIISSSKEKFLKLNEKAATAGAEYTTLL
ncbi:pyruvate:ferredoxin oxidoreductase and related 2-oxoacid:ferredoxin oxidoreductases, gamma subunit [Candidatus Gastranaerophilus sp. (ex Termes propinquus)]|nr:pyruvate:ferredoxin oxidoreductase and related 2-oxoacid:ferredoxin oxidoreductases, gamma subunit [Candidatus Gastranaerophilus sp. (ex Termes propinquus)]